MAIQSPSKAVISSVGGATSGGTAYSTKPVITGTADVGTTVNVYDGARLLGTAKVDASGSWTFTAPADLKLGSHSFSAIAVSSTGSFGTASTAMAVTISGAVAPVKPIVGGGMTDDQGHPLPNPTTIRSRI
jgi:VCBS repeat-containing protein